MIRFFQKLKARKGFTLVELIVVIAIIGVLAAILIPTMLGYVTSSRVTSANSTAASMKNNIDNFLTDCDTSDYGMLKGTGNTAAFTITITGGSWTVNNSTVASFRNARGMSWGTTGTGTRNATKVGVTNPTQLLAINLADLFPEIQSGAVYAYCIGGKCVAVAWTADKQSALTVGTDCPNTGASGWASPTFGWDTHTAGVSSSGFIVGTAPVVPLG